MEAVFELLSKSPNEDRLFLTAIGVAESENDWPLLYGTISRPQFATMVMSKIYLNAVKQCLENLDVSLWDLPHLEGVLVQCMPRWGSMIEKESLSELCGLLAVVTRRGLCIRLIKESDLPSGFSQFIHGMRYELLRILWYSSAISTLFQLLKCVPGDEEDSVCNILLENHKSDESRRTVIEAQENAIACLSSLVSLVSDIDASNTSSGLAQLKSTLSDSILAGVSASDLSSCPFIVSLCSFITSSGKTKPPPTTVQNACICLTNIIRAFDIPPSSFISAPRFRKLNDRLVTALISDPSDSAMQLFDAIVMHLPTIVPIDKKVSNLIQDNSQLGSIPAVFAAETFSELAESFSVTCGRALMLTRLIGSSEKDVSSEVESFLAKSVANADWIKSNILPTRESVDLLSNFFSFLQSIRVDPEWVLMDNQVHEPTLSHFVFHATKGSSRLDRDQVDEFNTALCQYRSRQELLTSLAILLGKFLASGKTGDDIPNRLKNAILTCFADSNIFDETVVREYPEVINKLLVLLLTTVEHQVKASGITLTLPSGESGKERSIMISTLLRIVPFARSPKGMECLVTAMRCLPHWLLVQSPDETTDQSDDLYLLLEQVCRCVPGETILRGSSSSCDPIIFSTMEAMVQFIAKSPSMVACNKIIFDYLEASMDSLANLKTVTNQATLVAWLSLMSSVIVLQEQPDSISFVFLEKIWTILACHPAIQALASVPVWENNQYTVGHLAWVYVLQLATVLLPFGSSIAGVAKFFATYKARLTTRFTTAHTSDLASIEEACLIARLTEAAPMGSIEAGSPLESPFQFTSLITYKSPSIYPKSRSEKIGGNLESIMFEDVRMACSVPCVFAQRIVWLAADIVSSVVRRIIKNFSSRILADDSVMFHSLLDCSHFVTQYLKELTLHEHNVLRLVQMNEAVYVPLSMYIQPGDSVPPDSVVSKVTGSSGETGGGPQSLLKSLPSPVTKGAIPSLQPRASLMDSLSPKNAASKLDTKKSVTFYSPRTGDCPQRAGLSFIAPALVTQDDYVGKLIEVLSLCLIQAMRLASSESLVRPLLDLLMSMKSNADKLPSEVNALVADLVDIIAPRYNSFSEERRQVGGDKLKQNSNRIPIYPTIGNIKY